MFKFVFREQIEEATMPAKVLCLNYFKSSLSFIHKKRVQALFDTSWGLTKHAELTLTSLGRHKEGAAYVKHKIKSVDRLIGNKKLHKDLPSIYEGLFHSLLDSLPILFIIVDWSGCCRQDVHMLRATLVHDGRGLTIYNSIHPQAKVGNAQIHRTFLSQLSKIIPFNKRVVIITDGGFATPWFKAVLKMGWDYVGRINRNTNVYINDNWIGTKELNKRAGSRVSYVGSGKIGKKVATPVFGSIYTYKERSKNRKDKSSFPDNNRRYSKINKQAWILATSLSPQLYKGANIKNIYKKRMQIEQNFRDDKNQRWGFGWRLGRTSGMERIAILCLIACIGAFFLWRIGMIAEAMNLHRRFQVNSEKNKRLLSWPFLARQVLLHQPECISKHNWYLTAQQFICSYREKILCS